MIDWLYPALILVGLTMGGVLLALRRQARAASDVALALARLNESLGFDCPSLLNQAWPLLERAGFRGWSCDLDWFGARLRWRHGDTAGADMARQLAAPDIRLEIRLYPPRAGGERRYFAALVAETLFLLLQTDLWIKAGGVASALGQFQRMTLFLGHDMKNMAQFIQLMADQVDALSPAQEARFVGYLRGALPLMRERGGRLLEAIRRNHPGEEAATPQCLECVMARIAQLYHLTLDIHGEATLLAPAGALDGVLDNLLKNYADHAPAGSASPIEARLDSADGQVLLTLSRPDDPPPADPGRLFEPFWSDAPSGLGLGLYQARRLAQMMGGDLHAEPGSGGALVFRLSLPARVNFLDSGAPAAPG